MPQTSPRNPGHQKGHADSLAAPGAAGGLGCIVECNEDSTGSCVNPAHRHQPTRADYCAKFGHSWSARWSGRELRDFVCRRCGAVTDWVDPR